MSADPSSKKVSGDELPAPFEALPAGSRLDAYEIQRVTASDGFVISYLGTDLERQQPVEIEEYLPGSIALRSGLRVQPRSDSQAEAYEAGLRAFVDESLLLAGCRHPALLRVARGWKANGTAYRELQLNTGTPLRDLRESMEAPPDQTALMSLIDALSGALQTLHAAGGLHLDISPDSIWLSPSDRPLLAGFAAARRAVVDDRTQALMGLMQPIFVPPEQIDAHDHRLGPWSDVYALAAVVRFCIEGRSFVGTGGAALLPPLSASIARLRERHPGLAYDPAFVAAIEAAMAPRPEARLRSAAALRVALGLPVDETTRAASEWPLPPLSVAPELPRRPPRAAPRPPAAGEAAPVGAPAATPGADSPTSPSPLVPAPTQPVVRGMSPPMAPAMAAIAGLPPVSPRPRAAPAQGRGWSEPTTAPTPLRGAPTFQEPGARVQGVPVMGAVPGPAGTVAGVAGAPQAPRAHTPGPLATDPPSAADAELLARIRADLDVAMGVPPPMPGAEDFGADGGRYRATGEGRHGVLATVLGVLLLIGALGAAVWAFDEDRVVLSTLQDLFGTPGSSPAALPSIGAPDAQGAAPVSAGDRSRLSAEAALAAAEAALAGATGASATPNDVDAVRTEPPEPLMPVPPAAPAAAAREPTAPAASPVPAPTPRAAPVPAATAPAPRPAAAAAPRPAPVPTPSVRAPTAAPAPAQAPGARASSDVAAVEAGEAGGFVPGTPREACEPRTQFALYRCMQNLCDTPRWREHNQCVLLRATDEVPSD